MGRLWIMWGCIFGFLTVGLGAFAAHGIENFLDDEEKLVLINTANQYLAYHTFAILILGLWNHWEKWANTFFAGIFFTLGIFLFCGGLYSVALFDFEMGGKILAPIGGTCFLLGWIRFAMSVLKTNSPLV